MKMVFFILAFLCCAWSVDAKVKVVDGDSLVIDGKSVRLEGVDAPEYKQYCFDAKRAKYRCGISAKNHLEKLVRKSKDFSCEFLSVDRYNRKIARCFDGHLDVNRQMVRDGWAVAYYFYDDSYVEDEKFAKSQKRGIWRGKFMRPDLFRALKR